MTHREDVLKLLGGGSILRVRDFKSAGIPAVVLTRMLKANELESPQRGLYRLPYPEESLTNLRISEIAKSHPAGVVCLMSALRYHGMTDDMNSDWTVAIASSTALASTDGLRRVRWSNPSAFEIGVETVRIAGAETRITNPARTVADVLRKVNGYSDEHALKAFGAFLKDGGDPITVGNYARALGFDADTRRLVPFAQELMNGGAFQPSDLLDFTF